MDWIDRALNAKRESKYIEFKSEFNPGSNEHWCETLKDIVAISNSGGGGIIFGLDSRGVPTGQDVSNLLALDSSVVSDKVYQYTGIHFSGFDLSEHQKGESKIAALQIEACMIPIVFIKPGTYVISDHPQQQKTAFSQGTVYFRHGAKSEPGNSEDISQFIERRLENIRKEWLDGVQKVVRAPEGSGFVILPGSIRQSEAPDAIPFRITDDLSAPGFREVDHDETHPHRQKELMEVTNNRLPAEVNINPYDVLVVRKIFDIDSTPEFFYHPKYGNPQYSNALIDWLVKHYLEDPRFFLSARQAYHESTH